MAGPTLRALLSQKSASAQVVRALREALDSQLHVVDSAGRTLVGEPASAAGLARAPVARAGDELGAVLAPPEHAAAWSGLLAHLADREAEQRALAAETLILYREIHLIERLSEELAALLNVEAICASALAQARLMIPATHGAVFVRERAEEPLVARAVFAGAETGGDAPLPPELPWFAHVLERGTAEIVNNCAAELRAQGVTQELHALLLAPLRTGTETMGILVLADAHEQAAYSSANQKLLHTIALQTATAIRNALQCAEMVETARSRAAYAAELQAASSVQQMLLQSASRPTPGFHVDSVYLPASEVGGDFFFVQPGKDGSLLAIVGDVSGKGLTAAMRVAMILGVLRRETSEEPGEVLGNLNNALAAQGQLGFTTACSLRIWPSGRFTFANAGHLAPYLAGRELEAPAALPLGILPEQAYAQVEGQMDPGDQIVLLSDGVPEAQSAEGVLFGFERLPELTRMGAQAIADAARTWGQEDDISVVTLRLANA